MTLNIEELATLYKIEPDVVKKRIDEYSSKVKEQLASDFPNADELNKEVERIVLANIGSLFRLSGIAYAKDQYNKGAISKIDCIILGVSSKEDGNGVTRRIATSVYYDAKKDGATVAQKTALNDAIAGGQLAIKKLPDGKEYPVALDTHRTIKRDGEEVENPEFGKEIPYRWRVQVPMIITGKTDVIDGVEKETELLEFRIGYLKWDDNNSKLPAFGRKSSIYGKINPKSVTVYYDGYEDAGVYDKAYDFSSANLPTITHQITNKDTKEKVDVNYWCDLSDVSELAPYTLFATKGTVQSIMFDKEGNSRVSIRIGDENVANGIKMSTYYPPAVSDARDRLKQGDNVIVFAKGVEFTNKDTKDKIRWYELWGFIVQPNDTAHSKAMDKLKAAGLI